jgi:hypothetical protein
MIIRKYNARSSTTLIFFQMMEFSLVKMATDQGPTVGMFDSGSTNTKVYTKLCIQNRARIFFAKDEADIQEGSWTALEKLGKLNCHPFQRT